MQVEVSGVEHAFSVAFGLHISGMSLPDASTCTFTSQLYIWLESQCTSAYE